MSLYLIGDPQGCDDALQRLLERVAFSPSRDRLIVLGDLVNRGPDSLGVLRRLMAMDDCARCVLGNHDLHLLAVAHAARKPHRNDTLAPILTSPRRDAMLDWMRHQPMALLQQVQGHDLLMVHAGVLRSWTVASTMAYAAEVESVLRGPELGEFLIRMYGNTPRQWRTDLQGLQRLRAIVNVLTRLRFCTPDDRMEFEIKEGAHAAPPGFWPWFDAPGRCTAQAVVAFGHWSTLGWLGRSDVLSLDTGCVWGGSLSAVRLEHTSAGAQLQFELIQIPCTQAQQPGG